MIQTATKVLTLEEFLKLPETKPASEFVQGEIIQKPMAQGKHSAIQIKLALAILTILQPQRIAQAYPELRCTFGNRSIVPDITVFQWEHIPRDPDGRIANKFLIPPDWTIEILSPDQSQTKVVRNILHCLNSGTQMGWLIDPEEELVFVYFGDRTLTIYEEKNAILPVPPWAESVNLSVGQIFDWLSE